MTNKQIIEAMRIGIEESSNLIKNLREVLAATEEQLAKFDQPNPKIKVLTEHAKHVEEQLLTLLRYSYYTDGKINTEKHPVYKN